MANLYFSIAKHPTFQLFTLVVDCTWGSWGPWGSCSSTCGGGTQNSTRVVDRPAQNGGANCTGKATKEQSCNTHRCPGMYRAYIISDVQGSVCLIQFQLSIIVDCTWGNWGPWGSCSTTCGGGTQNSTRVFDRPAQNGGDNCTGNATKEQSCNTHSCPGMYRAQSISVVQGSVCLVLKFAVLCFLPFDIRNTSGPVNKRKICFVSWNLQIVYVCLCATNCSMFRHCVQSILWNRYRAGHEIHQSYKWN